MSEPEEWRDVPGFEGKYQVSSLGGVRSLPRTVPAKTGDQFWPGKDLKPFKDPANGYLYVNLANGPRVKKCAVHRLVLLAFMGAPHEGHQACHNDGDRLNARLDNLRWDTISANAADRRRHGTHQTSAKLTRSQVAEIRASSETSVALAKVYGVASSTIRAIRLGTNWSDTPRAAA